MFARLTTPIAVALATVDDLPGSTRARPDAERRVSRIAARRAIRRLAGDQVAIELRRRAERPPLARFIEGTRRKPVALALTHRDGRAAAIAAPQGTQVGIDIERLNAVDPTHQHFFLALSERRIAASRPGALLWALKEAVWKALQLDGSVGFHEMELELDDTAQLTAVSFRGNRLRAVSAVSTPWTGYVLAAVVLEQVQ